MRVRYVCDQCGHLMAELKVSVTDLKKLGLSQLTAEEQEDIISFDDKTGVLTVTALCDNCVEMEPAAVKKGYTMIH